MGDCRARPRGQWEEAQGLGPSLVLAACCLAACRHVHVSGWRGLRVSVSTRASGCRGALRPAERSVHHLPAAVAAVLRLCPEDAPVGDGRSPQGTASLLALVS